MFINKGGGLWEGLYMQLAVFSIGILSHKRQLDKRKCHEVLKMAFLTEA